MNVLAILGWLPAAGVAAGLTRAKSRRLPIIAAFVAVAAYAAYLVSLGAWSASCWDCKAGLSETRGDGLVLGGMFFGVYLVLTLAGIWLGARFSGSLARLIATLREARSELRPGPPSHSE